MSKLFNYFEFLFIFLIAFAAISFFPFYTMLLFISISIEYFATDVKEVTDTKQYTFTFGMFKKVLVFLTKYSTKATNKIQDELKK